MKAIPVIALGAAVLLLISRWLPLAQLGFVDADNGPFLFRAILSVIVVGAALYTLLSKKYGSATEKWAVAAIGTVLGYWLA